MVMSSQSPSAHRHHTTLRPAAVLLGLCWTGAASASPTIYDCSSGEAPAAYSSESCTSSCQIIALFGGLGALSCDFSSGVSSGVTATLVSDYSSASYDDYSIWGTDQTGTDFCCWVDDSTDQMFWIEVIGTSMADTISFDYGSDHLAYPSAAGGFLFTATVEAGGGADTITGSDETNSDYLDVLHGEGGADTIHGGQGGDYLIGGAANDYLYGEGGNDTIWGGTGADYMSGAAGNNTICGGGNSNGNADYFVALSGTNIFWEPYTPFTSAPAGSVTGSNTTCGSTTWASGWASSGPGSCTYNVSAEPSICSLY